MFKKLADDQVFITLVNLEPENASLPNTTSIAGDARKIEAEDSRVDVVFSNSVIEHVGANQDQMQMAQEVRRVGKRYFIQTPNKYFPLEPHFLFPLFQFCHSRYASCSCRILTWAGSPKHLMP